MYLLQMSQICFSCFLKAWLKWRLLHGPLWAETRWLRWLALDIPACTGDRADILDTQRDMYARTFTHIQTPTPWQEEILQLWLSVVQSATKQWWLQWHLGNAEMQHLLLAWSWVYVGRILEERSLWNCKGKGRLEGTQETAEKLR